MSRTATSGANSTVSSSWKEEHSQITVASGSTRPTSADSGGADVARDRDRCAGGPEDMSEPLDDRGLAVRTGYGDERVGQCPPGDLELADDRDRAIPGCLHQGSGVRHTGTLDQGAHALRAARFLDHPGALRRRGPKVLPPPQDVLSRIRSPVRRARRAARRPRAPIGPDRRPRRPRQRRRARRGAPAAGSCLPCVAPCG